MDAKIDNLLIRFPFATRDQVADALRQEGNHAGRAGVRLAKLDPSLDGGEANGGTQYFKRHGMRTRDVRPTPRDFDPRCREQSVAISMY